LQGAGAAIRWLTCRHIPFNARGSGGLHYGWSAPWFQGRRSPGDPGLPAEKVNQDIDSPLNAKVLRRARDLVTAPEGTGVTAIYDPGLKRNSDTARPLADRLGLEVRTFSRGSLINTRQFAEAFVRQALAQQAGGVVLWVGNSSAFGDWGGNLHEVYRRLGGTGPGPRYYDDLDIIRHSDHGPIEIQAKTYGPAVPHENWQGFLWVDAWGSGDPRGHFTGTAGPPTTRRPATVCRTPSNPPGPQRLADLSPD
jgi:hypothetical protein